jgi:general stress protein 26
MTESREQRLLETARSTIKNGEYCFFITQGESGSPNARLMQPYEPEADMTVWLGASPRARKIRDLRRNNEVTLAFFDPRETGYVTLQGTAEVVENLELRRKYWRVYWNDFYPGGPESDDYVLIKFTPNRIEMMNFAQKVMPQPYGLRPAILRREGKGWKELDVNQAY